MLEPNAIVEHHDEHHADDFNHDSESADLLSVADVGEGSDAHHGEEGHSEADHGVDHHEDHHGDASEEAELTLLQLHQVQEELEHYFLKSKSSDELAEAQSQQLSRSQSLLSRLIQQPGLELQSIRSVEVEVLPPESTQMTSTGPVQTEALLDSYKTSLQRATDLLKQKFGN